MPMKLKRTQKDSSNIDLNLLALSGEIGIKLAIPLLTFMLIGIWLDKKYNTLPLFMLVGAGLALADSTYMIYKMIKRVNQT